MVLRYMRFQTLARSLKSDSCPLGSLIKRVQSQCAVSAAYLINGLAIHLKVAMHSMKKYREIGTFLYRSHHP